MLVFKVGREYRFQCDEGEFVGTFKGHLENKLFFEDVTKIIDSQPISVVDIKSSAMFDAEEWYSSMPFADTQMVEEAMRVIKRVACEMDVLVPHCNKV